MHGFQKTKNRIKESESEVVQPCPTLCDPVDCSPPGSPSRGFSRQEYWRGLPFPSPGDLPSPGIEPTSPVLAGYSHLLAIVRSAAMNISVCACTV